MTNGMLSCTKKWCHIYGVILHFQKVDISLHVVIVFACVLWYKFRSNCKLFSYVVLSHLLFWIESDLSSCETDIESVVIIHNGIYLVNCVLIVWQKRNSFRFPPRFVASFFYLAHSVFVWGKETKSWFYINYSINAYA